CFTINENGLSVVNELNSIYAVKLNYIGEYVLNKISKLSDVKVENDIILKIANTRLKYQEERHESDN
ncbi:hypothetical protein, partial [Paenibacillus allorhizoplanae]|uniref:hypothetical protein n=1 Tax=Paenibacillus allorhizoplanae TaxID=2905648 RepID=UPI001F30E8C2